MSAGRATAASVLATLLLTGGLAAQGTQRPVETIGPGMTEQAVQDAMGKPLVVRSRGDYTYYFYDNGCEKTCGFPDLVIFQSGQVVDAVFRAPWHDYTGNSSSPKGVVPRPNPGGERLKVPAGRVEEVEVRPAPKSPPDTTPAPRDTTGAPRDTVPPTPPDTVPPPARDTVPSRG